MEPDEQILRPPPPSTKDTPYEREVENAENLRRYDEAVAAKRERERIAGEKAETEKFAEARLREWLNAGGSEEDFRAAWPSMMAEHLSARRGAGLSPADQERASRSTPVF